MTTYIIRRFFQTIVFLFFSSLVVYTVLVMLLKDGPADLRRRAIEENRLRGMIGTAEDLERRYELDKPWPLNYLAWLFDPADTSEFRVLTGGGFDEFGNPRPGGNISAEQVPVGIDIQLGDWRLRGSGILTGDFGISESYAPGKHVSVLIGERWGYTLPLLALSLLLAVLIGVPLGVLGAINPRSRLDHFVTFISFTGLSVPPFVLGMLLIIVLAILPSGLRQLNGWTWLPFLPAGSLGEQDNLWDRLRHMVLPVMALTIPQIAVLARYSRFAMLEVLRQDYIRTAWAKGLARPRVAFKHALRNALLPIITVSGLTLPTLITGAVIVEVVFAYHGMGHLYYRALGGCLAAPGLQAQDPPPCPAIGYFPIDYPMALILTISFIAVVATANILADILYAAVDPRVNLRSTSRT